jgi:TolB protein
MTGINHKQAQRYLRAAADGLLRDDQRALLDAHLRECASCRAEADELKALEARLKKNFQARWDANDGPSTNVMTTIQSRSRRIIMTNRINTGLKLIAGLVTLLVLGFLFNPVIRQLQEQSRQNTPVAGSTSSGSLIAFAAGDIQSMDIYVVKPDGSGLTNLTNSPHSSDRLPVWSPDGKKIAFVSAQDGSDDIYVMNANGSGLTRLTTFPGSDTNPVWSPDGKKIAYSAGDDKHINGAIMVMDADGRNQQLVISYNPNTFVYPDSWSRDSQSIYFEVYRQVVQIGVNGGDVKAITPPTDKETPVKFAWSKDGSILMYLVPCSESFFCFTLKAINQDGTGEKNLATLQTPEPCKIGQASTWYGSWIKWSPDRTKILFTFTCEDSGWIYIANADGTNFAPLTNYPVIGNGIDHEVATSDWSPDGQSIVFTSALDQTDKFGIYTLKVNDALENPSIRPTRLVDSLALASSPAWQPQPKNEVVENIPTPAPLTFSLTYLLPTTWM